MVNDCSWWRMQIRSCLFVHGKDDFFGRQSGGRGGRIADDVLVEAYLFVSVGQTSNVASAMLLPPTYLCKFKVAVDNLFDPLNFNV